MADRRDDVDSWLSERIDPLPPPPGTFDLIKRRAKRRKYRRLAITASTAAVIVAAAVTVPRVVNLPVLSPSSTAGVEAGHPASATPAGGGRTASASSSASAEPSPSAVIAPVPPNFRPTSVTFVGAGTGWAMGLAGLPGDCATAFCMSVARTDNAGKTWSGVPAPLADGPDGASGVSKIRFLNTEDGWAFGPELFSTANGGQSWAQVSTGGLRVTDLETVGNRAFALFASCSGEGTSFGDCTSFTLYSSPASSSDWTPVGASTSGLTNGGAHEAASLVLTGSRGFVLAPGGGLYAGPVDGSGPWTLMNTIAPDCPVGPAQMDGQPSGALLAAVNARELILACASGSSGDSVGSATQKKEIFSSPNGGSSWLMMATAPRAGIAFSVAASPSATVVLATDQGIDVLPAGDTAWQTASLSAAAPAAGFGYVGMTTDSQGIALPANPAAGTVWFTYDGGHSWQPSHLSGS
ncbi:MAG: hypothetical protein M3Z75_00130 [Actinomycetota bacterium]|nr:hypothetical protein [Actinomycetota bacterium]